MYNKPSIATIFVAIILAAGVIWGVATLVSTVSKANEGVAAYNFIQQSIASQKQAPASAIAK